MRQLKAMITSGLITLVVCLTILGTVLAMTDTQPVQADNQLAVVSVEDEIIYLPLTDAPPQRDLALQEIVQ